jgi:hypothetical protein
VGLGVLAYTSKKKLLGKTQKYDFKISYAYHGLAQFINSPNESCKPLVPSMFCKKKKPSAGLVA